MNQMLSQISWRVISIESLFVGSWLMTLQQSEIRQRIYANEGNRDVIELLPNRCMDVLDVGCGAGDNARLLKTLRPGCRVAGVTHSRAEADLARPYLDGCWILDIEQELSNHFSECTFDALLFSHVLEHMRHPKDVLARFAELLRPDGIIVIAVPNILGWRQRIKFLRGDFRYQSHGPMDDTHLRFMTFETVEDVLLRGQNELKVEMKTVTGGFPLWFLRRHWLPSEWRKAIDAWGCRCWPNLFGSQILLRLRK